MASDIRDDTLLKINGDSAALTVNMKAVLDCLSEKEAEWADAISKRCGLPLDVTWYHLENLLKIGCATTTIGGGSLSKWLSTGSVMSGLLIDAWAKGASAAEELANAKSRYVTRDYRIGLRNIEEYARELLAKAGTLCQVVHHAQDIAEESTNAKTATAVKEK